MNIWTLTDQREIKPIDKNNEKLFEQLQKEVISNDLIKYMGYAFYQELLRDSSRAESKYPLLISGGTYYIDDCDNLTYQAYVDTTNDDTLLSEDDWLDLASYQFNGLKHVCSYLLFARYIRQSYIQDTFSGLVQHNGNDFQRISQSELSSQEARYLQIAATEWNNCVKYLETLDSIYFQKPNKPKTTTQWYV